MGSSSTESDVSGVVDSTTDLQSSVGEKFLDTDFRDRPPEIIVNGEIREHG